MRLVDADEIVYDIRDDEGTMVVTAEDIAKMPTVDAEPVKHGKWLTLSKDNYKCSVCGSWWVCEQEPIGFDYCPSCGAKMGEVTE